MCFWALIVFSSLSFIFLFWVWMIFCLLIRYFRVLISKFLLVKRYLLNLLKFSGLNCLLFWLILLWVILLFVIIIILVGLFWVWNFRLRFCMFCSIFLVIWFLYKEGKIFFSSNFSVWGLVLNLLGFRL